jgi:hypothetical protein
MGNADPVIIGMTIPIVEYVVCTIQISSIPPDILDAM